MTLNRMSGFAVFIVGIVIYFWIIPYQTETMDSGWLKPTTLPRITAVIMIISGVIHFISPTGKADFDVRFSLRVGLFFVTSAIGLYLMGKFGFEFIAPTLILVIMILIGERRPVWLISGIVLLPLAIWCCVHLLLNKPLP
jgi:putative tricarboxylic transport membrane protein